MRQVTIHDKSTGALAIAVSVDPAVDYYLEGVDVNLSDVGGVGTLTVSIDSDTNAVYDIVLASQDMTAVTDFVYIPVRRKHIQAGDKVVVAWANANGRTYGVDVIYTKINQVD